MTDWLTHLLVQFYRDSPDAGRNIDIHIEHFFLLDRGLNDRLDELVDRQQNITIAILIDFLRKTVPIDLGKIKF